MIEETKQKKPNHLHSNALTALICVCIKGGGGGVDVCTAGFSLTETLFKATWRFYSSFYSVWGYSNPHCQCVPQKIQHLMSKLRKNKNKKKAAELTRCGSSVICHLPQGPGWFNCTHKKKKKKKQNKPSSSKVLTRIPLDSSMISPLLPLTHTSRMLVIFWFLCLMVVSFIRDAACSLKWEAVGARWNVQGPR